MVKKKKDPIDSYGSKEELYDKAKAAYYYSPPRDFILFIGNRKLCYNKSRCYFQNIQHHWCLAIFAFLSSSTECLAVDGKMNTFRRYDLTDPVYEYKQKQQFID